jgi:hypothetical protein
MVATAACDAVGMVFQPKCVSGCHSPGGLWPAIDLSSDATATQVVGAAQTYKCAADMTDKIVNASAPLAGSFFLYISGQTCGATTQMPFGGTPLSQTEIDCIKAYFTSKLH